MDTMQPTDQDASIARIATSGSGGQSDMSLIEQNAMLQDDKVNDVKATTQHAEQQPQHARQQPAEQQPAEEVDTPTTTNGDQLLPMDEEKNSNEFQPHVRSHQAYNTDEKKAILAMERMGFHEPSWLVEVSPERFTLIMAAMRTTKKLLRGDRIPSEPVTTMITRIRVNHARDLRKKTKIAERALSPDRNGKAKEKYLRSLEYFCSLPDEIVEEYAYPRGHVSCEENPATRPASPPMTRRASAAPSNLVMADGKTKEVKEKAKEVPTSPDYDSDETTDERTLEAQLRKQAKFVDEHKVKLRRIKKTIQRHERGGDNKSSPPSSPSMGQLYRDQHQLRLQLENARYELLCLQRASRKSTSLQRHGRAEVKRELNYPTPSDIAFCNSIASSKDKSIVIKLEKKSPTLRRSHSHNDRVIKEYISSKVKPGLSYLRGCAYIVLIPFGARGREARLSRRPSPWTDPRRRWRWRGLKPRHVGLHG